MNGNLLYSALTYRIRGALYDIHKNIGFGNKELVYQKALYNEFLKRNIPFEEYKKLELINNGMDVGVYVPNYIIDDKIVIEITSTRFLSKDQEQEFANYLKSTKYKLGLLVNFGSERIHIKRKIKI
jgi:GxxExxY protein